MTGQVAATLNDTQTAAYGVVAGLIPTLGFLFALGGRVKAGRETWKLPFRAVVILLFLLMVAGEAAAVWSLLDDEYSEVRHRLVIAGVGAAIVGVAIEGAMHLGIVGEPGSEKHRPR